MFKTSLSWLAKLLLPVVGCHETRVRWHAATNATTNEPTLPKHQYRADVSVRSMLRKDIGEHPWDRSLRRCPARQRLR